MWGQLRKYTKVSNSSADARDTLHVHVYIFANLITFSLIKSRYITFLSRKTNWAPSNDNRNIMKLIKNQTINKNINSSQKGSASKTWRTSTWCDIPSTATSRITTSSGNRSARSLNIGTSKPKTW